MPSHPRPRLIHVDDSLTAVRLFEAQVAALRPDIELESYRTIAEAREGLGAGVGGAAQAAAMPWLLVTDINLPGTLGTVLISWVRRHPLLHQIPIAVLSAASEADHAPFVSAHGVIRWLPKPTSDADVAELLRDRDRMSGTVAIRGSLEGEFAVAGVRALEAMLASLNRGAETVSLFHALHSFKGEAAALLFPDLAEAANSLETFVTRAREAGYEKLDSGIVPLRDGIVFLLEQLKRFGLRSAEEILDPVPALLLTELDVLGRNLPPPPSAAPPPAAGGRPVAGPAPWEMPDMGIDISSFERLQDRVKAVLKRSARVSEKIRETTALSAERMAEIHQLVKKLDNDCIEMAAALVAHFTVRGERIIAFLQTLVSEISRHAGRRAALELDINPELEIDQAVYGALKTIFVHLVRNAIDHGIESAEERLKAGKPPAGMIRVSIESDRHYRYRVRFEDDGHGIDLAAIRKEVARRGIQAPASDEKALELIFLDDVTTKTTPTAMSGRGMGMGAIRRMIEARKGTIAVASTLGTGTRFEITLTKVLKLQ